jgi:transposase
MRKDVEEHVKRIKAMDVKINYNDLARKLDCDPRTIKGYATGKVKGTRKDRNIDSKLKGFEETIIDKIDNCSATAMSIYKYIQNKGYTGKYGLVKNYVKLHKKDSLKKATIRFETNPGLQAQVDYKERKKMISKYGEVFEINIFLFVLGYSRTKYIEVTEDKKQDSLFKTLINAFKYIGGIPQEIIFDNMSTVVDRHNTYLGHVQFNTKFNQFAKDFNFKPVACKPYRPQTKGKVESLAKLTSRLDVYNYEFESFEDLKKIAQEICNELNSEISQAINSSPISRLEDERKYLSSLPNETIIGSYINKDREYKVSKESMITYLGNKYSVPVAYVGKKLMIRPDNASNTLRIYSNNDLVASHNISEKLLNYNMSHAIEIMKSEAFRFKSNDEIEDFISTNLNHMDILLSSGERI